MALQSVIFDNTVFNFFAKINCVNLHRLMPSIISDSILVPSEILSEIEGLGIAHPQYQSKVFYWTDQIRQNYFFKHCTTYDSVVFDLVKSKIDKGEADAVAQSQKTGVRLFITDDKSCLPFINENYNNIRTFSTFFLIALADIQGILPDYEKTIYEFHEVISYASFNSKTKKTHKAKLRYEYSEALRYLGISLDKKIVSKKTSLDTIFKKFL